MLGSLKRACHTPCSGAGTAPLPHQRVAPGGKGSLPVHSLWTGKAGPGLRALRSALGVYYRVGPRYMSVERRRSSQRVRRPCSRAVSPTAATSVVKLCLFCELRYALTCDPARLDPGGFCQGPWLISVTLTQLR